MPQISGGPKGLNKILEGAYSGALGTSKDKGKASRIAWGAAKKAGWHKNKEGKWAKKKHETDTDFDIYTEDITLPEGMESYEQEQAFEVEVEKYAASEPPPQVVPENAPTDTPVTKLSELGQEKDKMVLRRELKSWAYSLTDQQILDTIPLISDMDGNYRAEAANELILEARRRKLTITDGNYLAFTIKDGILMFDIDPALWQLQAGMLDKNQVERDMAAATAALGSNKELMLQYTQLRSQGKSHDEALSMCQKMIAAAIQQPTTPAPDKAPAGVTITITDGKIVGTTG